MKHKNLLLLISWILWFNNSEGQWNPQKAATGTGDLYSVFAIDSNHVCAAGYGGLEKTLDGGATWTRNVIISGGYYYSLHTDVPAAWYSLGANTTWYLKVQYNSVTLNSGPDDILAIHYFDGGCGVAAGIGGVIETTCDTGHTWTKVVSGVNANLRSVWSVDANIGCAVGVGGTIIRTVNGGASWAFLINASILTLNGVTFTSSGTGYICGNSGRFLKSTDSGKTWKNITMPDTNSLYGVYFVNPDTGYVVGTEGLILNTLDGGTTWTPMVSGTNRTLYSVHFPFPGCGWAVGSDSTILKYGTIITGNENTGNAFTFETFPNPSDGHFRVESGSNQQPFHVIINDMEGRTVFSASSCSFPLTMNVSGLNNGIYLLEILNDTHIAGYKKIIIMK